MLEVVPRSWVSRQFIVRNAEGTVADVNFAFWRERGRIKLGQDGFSVRREHAMRGRFLLEGPSGVVAEARKPSAWRNWFVVEYDGRRFDLRKRSAWFREFLLLDGARQIGSVASQSAWTRRADARMPENWPFPVQLFVVWLVLAMWNREAAAAAAGS